jgi:hypothetical protein
MAAPARTPLQEAIEEQNLLRLQSIVSMTSFEGYSSALSLACQHKFQIGIEWLVAQLIYMIPLENYRMVEDLIYATEDLELFQQIMRRFTPSLRLLSDAFNRRLSKINTSNYIKQNLTTHMVKEYKARGLQLRGTFTAMQYRWLLQHGFTFHPDIIRITLRKALSKGSVTFAELAIEYKFPIPEECLEIALRRGHEPLVEYLFHHGFDILEVKERTLGPGKNFHVNWIGFIMVSLHKDVRDPRNGILLAQLRSTVTLLLRLGCPRTRVINQHSLDHAWNFLRIPGPAP